MKDYCRYYIERFLASDVSNYIFKEDYPQAYNTSAEYGNAILLYHFLSLLDDVDTIELNEWLKEYFGRVKTKKTVTNHMYDFVKHLRQGDTFTGKNGAHKDMILHTILNTSSFFEEFIFRFNNKD